MDVSLAAPPRSWQRAQVGLRRPILQDLPVLAALVAIIVAGLVIAGWALGNGQLRTVWLGTRPMRLDTAVGFLLAGCASLMLSRASGTRPRTLAWVPIVALLGLCALEVARALFPLDAVADPGLTQAMVGDASGDSPLWMSPTVIISLLCVGIAMLLVDRRPMARTSVALLVIAMGMASLNVLDLLLEDGLATAIGSTAQMAPASAVTLLLLSVGVMALLGRTGPLTVFVGPSATARVARQLLFAALVVPATAAWVRLQGEEYGLYGAGTGRSLMIMVIVAILAVVIWQTARASERTEAARKAVLDELDRFFDVSVDLLATVDADGQFLRVNPAWTATLGHSRDQLLGHRVTEFIHPDDLEATVGAMATRFATRGTVHGFQNRYRHLDGSYRWLEWNTAPSADGQLAYTTARDITSRRHEKEILVSQRERLRQRNQGLAVRVALDPLTGLRNRAWFDRACGAVITRRLRRTDGTSPTAAIMFDLDHFGTLNNQYGHQAGDAVLRGFADLLSERIRAGDITARYGGEEFVAVLIDCTREEAARAADDIRAALGSQTFDHDGLTIRATVSAGCAALEPGMTPADLLARADLALSMAKRAGRNTVVVA